ncbi:MAG: hypothetical protein CSA20_06260 [Deltaproteobacteria bacterium]|nr:MAG: hypothetical protein CSA20_06260 [Deltaproteobacteria bacterium]
MLNVRVESECMTEKKDSSRTAGLFFYGIQFRKEGQVVTASSRDKNLARGTLVFVGTDHGHEPARVVDMAPVQGCADTSTKSAYTIRRLANESEREKYVQLVQREKQAFDFCNTLIEKHALKMNLVRVERFYNGGKIIFYFTAENRVDFRALVKDLVQEYRTRVEMRQVGVRHETKMIGGLGTCGRELCCSSFLTRFDSVSIKMAKEQDLPLNPVKISGLCNRLLCCLTYEYDTYKKQRRKMPKPGKKIRIGEDIYRVMRQIVVKNVVVVENSAGEEIHLPEEQWKTCQPVKRQEKGRRKEKKAGPR